MHINKELNNRITAFNAELTALQETHKLRLGAELAIFPNGIVAKLVVSDMNVPQNEEAVKEEAEKSIENQGENKA